MHPILKPTLRRGWRDLNTVQFGVAPAHARVLGPVDTATGSFLTLLDGTRGLPLLREEGSRMGLPDGHVDKLLHRLAQAGLLDDATGGGPAADALRARTDVVDRLRPDLAALSAVTPGPTDGIRKMAARRATRVRVRGTGRVGAVVAAILSGAGIGQVDVMDGGCVEPWDIAPGGLPADSVGQRRDAAARRTARHAAPGRPPRHPENRENRGGRGDTRGNKGERADGERPLSLVVLTPRDGLDAYAPAPSSAEPLVAAGTPHLYAGVIEGTGVVGPLVLPGSTACAGCLALNQTDHDPAWPRLLAQWHSGRQRHVPACDLALSTTVAGLAAAHALAFLDGAEPAVAGVRWLTSTPGYQWRAHSTPAHRSCPCGASEQRKGERTSVDREPHETMAG
ncbi:ThiF family adenylyltransferase [Streptomyces sp. NPDC059063]|uniref:ThiF family adenylyltransferase n=1 Tax=unclassified Streptomyces TaxID=2593676 RepID=UPI0036B16693